MSSFFAGVWPVWPPDAEVASVVSKSAESAEAERRVDGDERASLCDSPELVCRADRTDSAELPEAVEPE